MKIIIGYSMRSGSTLLQHILNQHSELCAYSDVSSFAVLAKLVLGFNHGRGNICVKPMDIFFLKPQKRIYRYFDKHIWLARDPRDSYLSSVESGYAYLFWPRGSKDSDIDTGLLKRWKMVYRSYFMAPERWYLLRYEDLVCEPENTLKHLFDYLGLPCESLLPFRRFKMINGGDYKIRRTTTVKPTSAARYTQRLSARQLAVFDRYLGLEMQCLGYN